MGEQVGIEAIKSVVKILIDGGEGIQEKFADDGKVKVLEAIFLVIGLFPEVYSIVRKGAQLKEEWRDFSDAEKLEVTEYVALELDLEKDDIEEKVERGFELLLAVDSFLRSFKKEPVEEPVEEPVK